MKTACLQVLGVALLAVVLNVAPCNGVSTLENGNSSESPSTVVTGMMMDTSSNPFTENTEVSKSSMMTTVSSSPSMPSTDKTNSLSTDKETTVMPMVSSTANPEEQSTVTTMAESTMNPSTDSGKTTVHNEFDAKMVIGTFIVLIVVIGLLLIAIGGLLYFAYKMQSILKNKK